MKATHIRAIRHTLVFTIAAFVAITGVPGLAFKIWRERNRS